MSQVAKFSGSFLLMIAVILLIGLLSLETGMCQEFNDTQESPFLSIEDEGTDAEFDLSLLSIPDTSDMKFINSQDMQNIASFSNGPMGLWSKLNTSITFGDDGSMQKTRNSGLFSYGSELMEINEMSWLTLTDKDELGIEYYSDGYNINTTLKDAKFPFAVLRSDLTTLSGENYSLVNSDSMTYLLLYDEFSTNYDLDALKMVFGNSSDFKTFKYDPEMVNLSTNLGFDLSMYFSSDIWSQFGDIFNNKEIMAMFHQLALDQQAAKNNQQDDDDNPFGPGRNWWEDSEGGVYCKWGAVP